MSTIIKDNYESLFCTCCLDGIRLLDHIGCENNALKRNFALYETNAINHERVNEKVYFIVRKEFVRDFRCYHEFGWPIFVTHEAANAIQENPIKGEKLVTYCKISKILNYKTKRNSAPYRGFELYSTGLNGLEGDVRGDIYFMVAKDRFSKGFEFPIVVTKETALLIMDDNNIGEYLAFNRWSDRYR